MQGKTKSRLPNSIHRPIFRGFTPREHDGIYFLVQIGFAILVTLVLPFVLPSLALGDRILIFAIAAVSLSLLWGEAGLMSFGQGIFLGGGAYAAGLAILHWHVHLLAVLGIGLLVGALLAAVIGALSTRRTGIYFVLLTFAFAEMFSFLIFAFSGVTGGENGLLHVARVPLTLDGLKVFAYDKPIRMYALCAVVFIICYVFVTVVSRSRFGSVLRAVRDNEKRCEFIGFNTKLFKVTVFILSGCITGIAGTLYALLLQSVPPSAMQVPMSEDILIMAILGIGRLWGSVFGAVAVVLLSDELSHYWDRWPIILGILLIAVVVAKSAFRVREAGSGKSIWRRLRQTVRMSDAR